jgi:hypothetical protein
VRRAHPDATRASLVVAVGLVAALGLAYAGKAVCIDGETGFWAETRYCYSDVRVLWNHRGFDVEALPYAGPPTGYPVGYTFEYPPGLAFPAWGISLVTDSRRGFFNLHALTFALAAVLSVGLLDRVLRSEPRRSRWRLLGFALSPALVLFGMQNWDLWAVAAVSAGVAAAASRRSILAAVLFGVGAAIKWWPALLVVVLMAGPWSPPDGRSGGLVRPFGLDLRPVAAGAAAWALMQVPALLVSVSGWAESIAYHLRRRPNFDSTAAAIAELGSRVAPGPFWGTAYANLWTAVSLVVLVGGLGYVVVRLRHGTLLPADAALAAVALFLLTSKVFSPQFVLWLLPVAVVASVRWWPVLAVEASNAAVWLLYGPWMARWPDGGREGFLYAAQGASVVRTVALAWLVAAALRRTVSR